MGGSSNPVKRVKKSVKRTVKKVVKQAKRTASTVKKQVVRSAPDVVSLGTTLAVREFGKAIAPDINIEGDAADIDTTVPGGAPSEEARLSEFTDEELDARKKKSKRRGAKSLQIPLGGTGGGTIGTGK